MILLFKVSQIFLGENDGKKEALYHSDFINYYFNYDNIYEKTLEPKTYLVLGKKGTGKTLLAEYIKKKAKDNYGWFCTISSYKSFRFHELRTLASRDIKPNEYMSIWEWILLMEISKLLLNDEELLETEEGEKLSRFIKNNYGSLSLDMNKVVEITKNKGISFGLKSLLLNATNSVKSQSGSYLEYIDDLKSTVISLLRKSNNRYTVIFDELDDQFRNDDIFKSNIISLIKVADNLNILFLENDINAKFILMLRTDIFYILNDTDLNKIESVNSIKLDWGNTVTKYSPLFKLILNKVRKSVPEFSNTSDKELFNILFPQKINYRSPEEFILGRTFFRPRDLITYLTYIIKKYPNSKYFGDKGFLELEGLYSEYFVKEIRNELKGHLSDLEIDESLLMLKQYKKANFYYKDIKEYYKERVELYPSIKLEKTLKVLFDFGLLGNKWYDAMDKRYYYSWKYRKNVEVDFDKQFVTHLGVRKELIY